MNTPSFHRRLAILGSTGSIGTQALEILKPYRDAFSIELLTAGNNAELLIAQAAEWKPATVAIANEAQYDKVFSALDPLGIKVYSGAKSIALAVEDTNIDMVLTAMVGAAGLTPTIHAIKAGKHIALANKETLVVAGQLITQLCEQHKVSLLPVDSEHSAIFQCLVGEEHNEIEKIILTASGGPFRGYTAEQLQGVTRESALKHPRWTMGAKITIDSATLMNKGLEVIEAKWLFDLSPEQVDVVVHPQSIIHSMVQMTDGSVKAQLGLPDMKLPILYALAYPMRQKTDLPRMDLAQIGSLTFEKPDMEVFRCLGLAFKALHKGGNAPCVLNAANEVAVNEFLSGQISFTDIAPLIEETLLRCDHSEHPELEDLLESDAQARGIATQLAERSMKLK